MVSAYQDPENGLGEHWHTKVVSTEEYWINRSYDNVADFQIYMTDGEKRPAKHHIQWYGDIFNFDIRRLIIEAFPGAAKTTSVVYSTAWLIGHCPWLTHMIVSVSEVQAKQRLSEVKEIIESERFKNIFPHVHVDKKRQNNQTTLNVWSSRWKDGKEVNYATYRRYIMQFGEARDDTIFACGITSMSITGKRITGFIIVDDPHNETNSNTPEAREKVTNAIKKELISRFSHTHKEFCKMIIIMTPWAEDDCAGRLMEDHDLKGKTVWVMRKTPIRDEIGNPTWSEFHTKEDVANIEANMGVFFELMHMLNPLALAGNKITLDMLRKPIPEDVEYKDITITVDFAQTEGLQSDYTAIGAIGRDEAKYFNSFFIDGIRVKEAHIARRVQHVIDFYDQMISLYGGAVKKVLLHKVDSDSEFSLIRSERPDIPVEMIQTKGDKEMRFKVATGMLQNGRCYFNMQSELYPILASELISFPRGKHDDCVDMFDLPFQQPAWFSKAMRSGVNKIRSQHLL